MSPGNTLKPVGEQLAEHDAALLAVGAREAEIAVQSRAGGSW